MLHSHSLPAPPSGTVRLTDQVLMSPADFMAGLGAADREFLATCLALFDDSKLTQRMTQLFHSGKERLYTVGDTAIATFDKLKTHWPSGHGDQLDKVIVLSDLSADEIKEAAEDVRSHQRKWQDSYCSDDQLRLLLWIRLREALGLDARLSISQRGTVGLADDLVAHLIHALDPPSKKKSIASCLRKHNWLQERGWLKEQGQARTLADIVLPVLDELLEKTLEREPDAPRQEDRHRMVAKAVASLRELNEEQRRQLLESTQANRINDTAIRNSLILGGSLSAFSASVGSAGFSAYILAAQASALIPLVSGPGLVSLVSVLASPVSIVGLTGMGTWWAIRSARDETNATIAKQVVALLAIRGLQAGPAGIEAVRRSFTMAPLLERYMGLKTSQIQAYQREHHLLGDLWQRPQILPEALRHTMERPVNLASLPMSATHRTSDISNERYNSAAMATMTIGDMLYSAAAVDPTVVAAADFSRIAEIDGPISFSVLAQSILTGAEASVTGGTSQLHGYVAEQVVAQQLTAQGHIVSFPETSNEPGWDLLVDGQPFQVKFHDSLSGLKEHFERYDYPAIVSSELSDKLPEELLDRVFFIEGLSNKVVKQVTSDSLQAGVELWDTNPIAMAGIISATRSALAYRRGQLTRQQAIEQMLIDGSVRAGLAGGGALAGATIGTLVLGPAGGLVLTNLMPILAMMHTRRFAVFIRHCARGESHRRWQAEAHADLDALQQSVIDALQNKHNQIAGKIARAPDNPAGQYLCWRLADDSCFVKECQHRLAQLNSRRYELPEQRTKKLLQLIATSGLHPALYQSEMRQIESQLEARPGLEKLFDHEWMADLASDIGDHSKGVFQSTKRWIEDSGLGDHTRQWATRFSRREKNQNR